MELKPESLYLNRGSCNSGSDPCLWIASSHQRAQATNPPYLRQFPSVERVKAEIKGTDAMETAARQMGAFWRVQQIIKDLSGFR